MNQDKQSTGFMGRRALLTGLGATALSACTARIQIPAVPRNPAPANISRSALGISQQALTTTGRASALLQVNATQLFARENGLRFSVTSIDPNSGVVYDPSDRFSSTYMNALYRHGLQRAQGGTLWVNS